MLDQVITASNLIKSTYLTTFACQFGRNRFTRLPVDSVSVDLMFQQKFDEIFKGLANVFHLRDDIQIVGYNANGKDHDTTLTGDGRDHDITSREVMKI